MSDEPPDWMDEGSVLDDAAPAVSSDQPRPPVELIRFTQGFSAFAKLWRTGGGFPADLWAAAIALDLAARGFDRVGVRESLRFHDKLGLTFGAADRIASQAVADHERQARPAAAAGYTVRVIRWHRMTPAMFDLEVDGVSLTATSVQMATRASLRARCMDAAKVPVLPSVADYDDWLRQQIESAEVVEMPEEASDHGAKREFVRSCIDAMSYAEAESGLMLGGYVVHDGMMLIVPSLLFQTRIEREMPTLTRQEFYKILGSEGWESNKPHRFGDKVVKVARKPFVGERPPSTADELAEARRKREMRQGTFADVVDRPFHDEEGGA